MYFTPPSPTSKDIPNHPSVVALCPQKPILAYPCDAQKGHVCIARLNEPGQKTVAAKEGAAGSESEAYGSYQILEAHDHPVTCLAFRKDGQWLATASARGTIIRVWDTDTKALVMELKRSRVGREAKIHSLCFNDEGTMIVCSSSTKTIHIFAVQGDRKNDKAFAYIRLNEEKISESNHISSFRSDNQTVQVAFADGTYRCYKLPDTAGHNCTLIETQKLLDKKTE